MSATGYAVCVGAVVDGVVAGCAVVDVVAVAATGAFWVVTLLVSDCAAVVVADVAGASVVVVVVVAGAVTCAVAAF